MDKRALQNGWFFIYFVMFNSTLIVVVVVAVFWHPECSSLLNYGVVGFQPLGVVIGSLPFPQQIKINFSIMGWGEYQLYSWPRITFTLSRTWILFLHSYTPSARMCPVSTYGVRQWILIYTIWLNIPMLPCVPDYRWPLYGRFPYGIRPG